MTPSPADMFRALPDRLARWSFQAHGVATALHMDPLLLLAIMDRETRGGEACQPKGLCERGTGDNGNGLGLMQIDQRYHKTFAAALGPDGKPLWQDPTANILYAAKLLAMNLQRFKSEAAAVASYNASAEKVAQTMARVSPNADLGTLVAALDVLTTGKNYVSDVLQRRSGLQKLLTTGVVNAS